MDFAPLHAQTFSKRAEGSAPNSAKRVHFLSPTSSNGYTDASLLAHPRYCGFYCTIFSFEIE
jgi:hypothetical protein